MSLNVSASRKLTAYRLALREELAALFRLDPGHPGIERIVDEAEAHLEESIEAQVEDGATPEAATLSALKRFGTAARVARAYAAVKPPTFIDPDADVPGWRRVLRRFHAPGRTGSMARLYQLVSELNVAVRGLARSPGYAIAFILTLGLGIGANTAIFSVVHGVWLRPLPYRDGDRLVYLRHSASLAGIDNMMFSVPEIVDYRDQSETLAGVTEFSAMTFTILGLDEPKLVRAGIVTGNYFEVMGLRARAGRAIAPSDDGETAAPVAVLSYDYWRQQFGGDPDIIGKRVTMNDRSVEIIGVAEPAPPYPRSTDMYVNIVSSPHHLSASMVDDRYHRMTELFARLEPGATLEEVQVELDGISGRLHEEHPGVYDDTHGYEVRVTRLRDQLAAEARPTMFMLIGVAAFVLLIACANVANLTLTRVMRRYNEWGLRVSLGAKTWTLRRQLLIENLVPALGGAILGVVFAVAGVDILASYIARYSVRASEISVDTTVLAVALVVAVVAAALFALLPQLPGSDAGRIGWLSGARSTSTASGRRLQKLLVVSQVGVSFVLLVGAGLLLETLSNLREDTGGVALEEVLAMNVPINYGEMTFEERLAHQSGIAAQVRTVPGVRSAALGSMIPLRSAPSGVSAGLSSVPFEIDGEPNDPSAPAPRADFRIVTGDYFRTLGMSLVRGRTFDARDERSAAQVVVVNQAFARHYFAERDPVGERIAWRGETIHWMGVDQEYRTIVGVVSDAKDYGVAAEVPHVVFNPFTQVAYAGALFIRTVEPETVLGAVLAEIRERAPNQPIVNIATLAQVRSDSISPQRLNATLVSAFAFIALAVAAVGVAGVLAFGVSQRTHEFGVRAALGADKSDLMRAVLEEGAVLAVLGLGIGLAAYVFFARLIDGLLHDVASHDVTTIGGVALLLTTVALVASAVPAWRAAEIDPVQALREE